MHVAERIALWTVIVLIIFFLFFKNSSGFTSSQTNLMTLNEFKWLPTDIKNSYASNMTKIINAIKPKLDTYMGSLPAANKQKMLNDINSGVNAYVARINSLTNEQIKDLANKAAQAPVVFAGPQVKPGQVNMAAAQAQPNVTQASPMGMRASPAPIGMAQVQAATGFPNNKVSVYSGTNFTGNVTFFEPSGGPIAFTTPLNVGSIYVPAKYKIEYKQANGSTGVIVGESKISSAETKITQLQVKN